MYPLDRIIGLTLLVVCVAFGYFGRDLSFLNNGRPGAGFFPMLIGAACLVQAGLLVMRPGGERVAAMSAAELLSIIRIISIVAFSLVIMSYAGFLISTMFMLTCFWVNDLSARPLLKALCAVAATSLGTYGLFDVLLNVPLPPFLKL